MSQIIINNIGLCKTLLWNLDLLSNKDENKSISLVQTLEEKRYKHTIRVCKEKSFPVLS